MKTNYGMTMVLLASLTITSCNSSKQISKVEPEQVVASVNPQQAIRTLTPNEWNGTWIIKTAEKRAVVGEEPVEITFNTQTGNIYACDGCNILNGIAVFGRENQLRFEQLISTMKACGSKVTDRAVQNAFNTTRSYQVVEGEDVAVKCYNENGEEVMSLVKRMANLLNGAWSVTAIDGKSLTDQELPSLVIDIQEQRISGFAGCNRMFGEIALGESAYEISFSQIGTTRMACPDMETERDFLDALERVKGFYLTDETHAALYQKPGKAIILLEKTK